MMGCGAIRVCRFIAWVSVMGMLKSHGIGTDQVRIDGCKNMGCWRCAVELQQPGFDWFDKGISQSQQNGAKGPCQ